MLLLLLLIRDRGLSFSEGALLYVFPLLRPFYSVLDGFIIMQKQRKYQVTFIFIYIYKYYSLYTLMLLLN